MPDASSGRLDFLGFDIKEPTQRQRQVTITPEQTANTMAFCSIERASNRRRSSTNSDCSLGKNGDGINGGGDGSGGGGGCGFGDGGGGAGDELGGGEGIAGEGLIGGPLGGIGGSCGGAGDVGGIGGG